MLKSCIFNTNDPKRSLNTVLLNQNNLFCTQAAFLVVKWVVGDANEEVCYETFSDQQMQIWHLRCIHKMPRAKNGRLEMVLPV